MIAQERLIVTLYLTYMACLVHDYPHCLITIFLTKQY